MKFLSYVVVALICSFAMVLPCQAGATGGLEVINQEAETSIQELQPLYSSYAQTATRWALRGGARFFTEAKLQEVDEFDGTSLDVELTVPLSDRFQFRFYYPFYTDGEARLIESGDKVDIDGSGGTLDFPSAIIDYQFMKAATPGDYNLAAFIGVGYILRSLDVEEKKSGELVDFYNHRGAVMLFGFKADKEINGCFTVIGNLGGRYYWDSDDIHINSQDDDEFWLVDASVALVYSPPNISWISPVIEVVYQGDMSDYNSVQVVPQVIVSAGSHVNFNAGVSIGVVDDAPNTEARVQMTLRY